MKTIIEYYIMHKGLTLTGLTHHTGLISAIACLFMFGPIAMAAPTTTSTVSTTQTSVQPAFSNQFVGLDFRINKQKEGVIVVKLSSSTSAVDIKRMPKA